MVPMVGKIIPLKGRAAVDVGKAEQAIIAAREFVPRADLETIVHPCVVWDPYYGWVNACPYSYYY
jgi:hypothetical protein